MDFLENRWRDVSRVREEIFLFWKDLDHKADPVIFIFFNSLLQDRAFYLFTFSPTLQGLIHVSSIIFRGLISMSVFFAPFAPYVTHVFDARDTLNSLFISRCVSYWLVRDHQTRFQKTLSEIWLRDRDRGHVWTPLIIHRGQLWLRVWLVWCM